MEVDQQTMRTFEFFIEDDRYAVCTLELVQVRDAARAREVAQQRLGASAHHRSVEVREDDELIFVLSRAEAPRHAERAEGSAGDSA
jgi:hypothetical protein